MGDSARSHNFDKMHLCSILACLSVRICLCGCAGPYVQPLASRYLCAGIRNSYYCPASIYIFSCLSVSFRQEMELGDSCACRGSEQDTSGRI